MKKGLLFMLLLGISLWLYAGVIEQTYYFDQPTVTKKGAFSTIGFKGLLISGITGEPALPYQSVQLLLPPGEVIYAVDIYMNDKTLLEGKFKLYPVQPSRPLSKPGKGDLHMNKSVYASNEVYPSSSTGRYTTEFLNGCSIGMFTFTPVEYNPASGEVGYHSEVKIVLHTKSSQKASYALNNLVSNEQTKKRLEHFVQNPSLIDLYPTSTKNSDDYDLLIITPSQFENNFQDLIEMYSARGVKTQLTTKEYIDGSVSGQDLAEKIRNFIIGEYQNHSVEYVLLGGDVEHIPYRGFYCYAQSGSGYEDDDIPADLYYSGLDGTWNDDGDNRWGEPGEDDLLPDIAVARFPFSTAGELANMINKSVMYQNSPVLGEFNDAVMAGEWLYSNPDTWGSDYLELLIGHQTENGYETWGIPDTYNFHDLYEINGSWSKTDLMNEINAGRQFIHHAGHASPTYVAYMSNSDITNSNFSGANGISHNFTLFQTHGCDCGAFDDNDCILEKMVTIQNFAVAVIGNARYGWFNEGQTEGPAAHLHREMMDALYHEKINFIGAAFMEAKIQTAPWVTAPGQWEEGALRWNFYDINVLGDPALAVWTAEPISIAVNHTGTYFLGSNTYEATVTSAGQPMQNFRCALIFNDEIKGIGFTDASGQAVIAVEDIATAGNATLVVSGYNCLPHEFDVTVAPAGPTYLHYVNYQINDAGGNNNGLPDCGETVTMDMTLENIGTMPANNVDAELSSADTYITITSGLANFGTIGANASVTVNDAFGFEIADDVPDQHIAEFEMTMTSGSDSWINTFSITVNAPLLEVDNISVDDSQNGNGNSILDPGETAEISVVVQNNGHCVSEDVAGVISSASTWITITSASTTLSGITPGNAETATFTIQVDASTPLGSSIDLLAGFTAGNYSAQQMFYLPVGLEVEDFESGDFNSYAWQFDGNADWTITSLNPYEGVYAAKSGAIGNQQTSELMITMNVSVADEISFYRKVSSEEGYDFLRFYIDNSEVGNWDGEEAWGQESYPVTAGIHTFKWVYEKDYSVAGGDDCAWIDYIVFPASSGSGNLLNVVASASPADICEGESAQLNAWVSGGTGNYFYTWTPATGLSDPSIANPVASPDATITYTITINDGNSTISDQTTVTVNPVPDTPVITQEDDHLVSDAASGNQWYDANGPVAGATGQTFYPQTTGNYYVKVGNEFGCSSENSNVIYFVYTGINEAYLNLGMKVYPNPVIDHFSVEYYLAEKTDVSIILYNNLVAESQILENTQQQPSGFYKLDFDKKGLKPGIYFISFITDQSNTTKKIVITK